MPKTQKSKNELLRDEMMQKLVKLYVLNMTGTEHGQTL